MSSFLQKRCWKIPIKTPPVSPRALRFQNTFLVQFPFASGFCHTVKGVKSPFCDLRQHSCRKSETPGQSHLSVPIVIPGFQKSHPSAPISELMSGGSSHTPAGALSATPPAPGSGRAGNAPLQSGHELCLAKAWS